MLFRTPRRALALAVALSLAALALVAQPLQRASADDGNSLALSWAQPVPDVLGKQIAVSPDGSRVYVPARASVEAFDTATHQPVGFVQIPVDSGEQSVEIEGLAVSPDGVLYAMVEGSTEVTSGSNVGETVPHLRMERIDFSSESIAGQVNVGFDNGGASTFDSSGRLLFSPDGSQAYVFTSNRQLDVVDTATMSVTHSWAGSYNELGLVMSADGLVGSWAPGTTATDDQEQYGVIDPNTGTVSRVLPLPDPSEVPETGWFPIGVLPDGNHLVQLSGSADRTAYEVSVRNLADGSVANVAQVPIPQSDWTSNSSAISLDGTTLFLEQHPQSGNSVAVSAVNLSSGAVAQVADVPSANLVTLQGAPGGGFFDVDLVDDDGIGTVVMYEFTPQAAGALPPLIATAQPQITNLQVGKTATVSAGSWSATPDSLSYQWYSDFAPIAGATSASLPVTAQLAGHRVFVAVTASAAGYARGTIASANPFNGIPAAGTLTSGVPTISGKAAAGSTLTAHPGTWTSGTALTYQWKAGGAAISGATKSTYAVTSAQEGKAITVTVTGKLTGYTTASVTSAATAKVPVVPYAPKVLPALAGSDRYGTAIAISKSSYPTAGSAKTVFVASGENFPDALSAASAAVKLGGPLLLTLHDRLLPTVAAEVKRLGPKRIVVVGGTSAVSAAVASSLAKIAPTTRVSGADRYATSLAIAKYAFGSTNVPSVFFATGTGFADALSASAFAGAKGMPVVLVPGASSAPSAATVAWLKAAHTTTVRIAGGDSAISSRMQSALQSAVGHTATRYAGADRFATNQKINGSSGAYPSSATADLASGMNFPDALAGAAAAGKADAPLYLVPSGCVPSATVAAMKAAGIGTVQPLGGPSAVGSGAKRMASCG